MTERRHNDRAAGRNVERIARGEHMVGRAVFLGHPQHARDDTDAHAATIEDAQQIGAIEREHGAARFFMCGMRH